MTTTNSYSTARMWALTKRCCVSNRRNIAITCGVILGLLLLASLAISRSMAEIDPSARAFTIVGLFVWTGGLIGTIIGSLTFSSMSTKPKRIANLMLPATQSEKFVSQCLLYVVGGNILLFVGMLLADTVSALLFNMTPVWMLGRQLFDELDLSHLPYVGQTVSMAVLVMLWMFLFGQSIYVLGSSLWPRRSFLKTFVTLMAIQIVIPFIIPFGLLTNFFPAIARYIADLSISVNATYAIAWGACGLLYALLALVYAVAWMRYKRMEAVKTFMMN